jgi:transposase-like protein
MLVSSKELATALQCHPETVRRWVRRLREAHPATAAVNVPGRVKIDVCTLGLSPAEQSKVIASVELQRREAAAAKDLFRMEV